MTPYNTQGWVLQKTGEIISVDELATRFCNRTLPKKSWTHFAHLRVALWHALRYPAEECVTLLRERISLYNEAAGGANTPTAGYHETITRFYVWVVDAYLKTADRGRPVDELADGLIDACGARDLPFRFYTRELLQSTEARLSWVEPDLRPLESLP